MHLRKVRGVGFGRITYGGAVDIDPGCLDSFYLVQVPLSGREVIDTGGQTVCSAGKVGSVINATGASLIRHEANTEKLVIRIEREVLERNCIQHLGHALRQPIGFLPSMTLDGVAGNRWTGLLRWIYESLALDDQCFDSPIMSAQVEQTVIATLLSAQPHNYSEELNGEERSIAPRLRQTHRALYRGPRRPADHHRRPGGTRRGQQPLHLQRLSSFQKHVAHAVPERGAHASGQ